MNLGEIRTVISSQLAATVGKDAKKYWPNADLNEYIQDAVNVFCRKTRIIRDSLTTKVCILTVPIGDQHLLLNPLILPGGIERVKASWRTEPLIQTTTDEVTELQPSWETDTGQADLWFTDYSKGYLSLNRAATEAGTIRLTVRRMPISPLTDDKDVPEINPEYISMLSDYVLYRAFSKQDSEVYNPDKANHHLALFQGTDELRPAGHIGRVLLDMAKGEKIVRHARFF
jgi:hypothetical protein